MLRRFHRRSACPVVAVWTVAVIVFVDCCALQRTGYAMNNQIPNETVATGYRPPRTDQPQPVLVVLYSQAAFDRQMGSLRATNKSLQDVHVDWKKNVLLWASCAVDAGMDTTPEVKSLTSESGRVHLLLYLRPHPDPQGLDVVTQAWILVSAPRASFEAKDLKVQYEVEGQGTGSVTYER
jgi:hypothetical protein